MYVEVYGLHTCGEQYMSALVCDDVGQQELSTHRLYMYFACAVRTCM